MNTRNEFEIKLGSETILLRPTFENMEAMESRVGSIAYLAYKCTKMGRAEMLTMSEAAKIIFYNQAAIDRQTGLKVFTVQEIYGMVMEIGNIKAALALLPFLSAMTQGNEAQPEITDAQKKS